jgi:hypothetical protein
MTLTQASASQNSMTSNGVRWFLPVWNRQITALVLMLALSLEVNSSVSFANGQDVETVVNVLTQESPNSDAFKQAQNSVANMSDAQLGDVVQRLAADIAQRGTNDIRTVVNLAFLAIQKGKRNPFGKLLDKVEEAVVAGGSNGIKIFTDPLSNPAKNNLAEQLAAFVRGGGGQFDTNDALLVVKRLETKMLEEQKRAREAQREVNAESRSGDSVSFTAANRQLSFTKDRVINVVDKNGVSVRDTMVGAKVFIPNLTFVGYTPEGLASFVNIGGERLIVQKGSNIFLTATLPSLLYDGHDLFSFLSDLAFAGASRGSPFDDNLPDLGSFYTGRLDKLLTADPFDFLVALSIVPDFDLTQVTGNFVTDANVPFTDLLFVVPEAVPEPSTLLLLGSSLAGLGGFAWRRQRRN